MPSRASAATETAAGDAGVKEARQRGAAGCPPEVTVLVIFCKNVISGNL